MINFYMMGTLANSRLDSSNDMICEIKWYVLLKLYFAAKVK